MNDFIFYFNQGVNHITDVSAIDHLVFIITMCAVFRLDQWRKLAVLITAFTVGHSLTLILAGLDIIAIKPVIVETLIPITILMTSITNVGSANKQNQKVRFNYILVLIFGLIHGMGFSNFFRSMMMGITDESIILPLFSFNVGIEAGQIIIASLFLSCYVMLSKLFGIRHENWNLYVSGAGGGIAATMILESILNS